MDKIKKKKPEEPGVVYVELSNRLGVRVAVDAQCWSDWVYQGGSTRLSYDTNGRGGWWVRVYRPDVAGKRTTLAREFTKAGKGWVVRPVDGNPLNLRLQNLEVVPGGARGQSRRTRKAA